MAQCIVCNKEFGALRSTAKYCSKQCKNTHHRETLSNETLSNETLSNETLSKPVDGTLNQSNNDWRSWHMTKGGTPLTDDLIDTGRQIVNIGPYLKYDQLHQLSYEHRKQVVNRVSLPGDSDYNQ